MNQLAIAERKKSLRAEISARRKNSEFDADTASDLAHQLIGLVSKLGSKKVACYLSLPEEPDTELFVDWALENGIGLLMPRSNSDKSLTWVEFLGETSGGIFGFAEPVGAETTLSKADLILVPALAASEKGERLGKGLGFYDRALSGQTTPVVAVVFDDEIYPSLPVDEHDHSVDAVVSPSNIVICSERFPALGTTT